MHQTAEGTYGVNAVGLRNDDHLGIVTQTGTDLFVLQLEGEEKEFDFGLSTGLYQMEFGCGEGGIEVRQVLPYVEVD
jgi:hypothetical protein